MWLPFLILGLWIGAIANAIWYHWCYYIETRKYKIGGKYRISFLYIFEHYHWATILFILGLRLDLPIMIGVGIVLLLDECLAQAHKFALGSGHERESMLVEVIILLLWISVEMIIKLIQSLQYIL